MQAAAHGADAPCKATAANIESRQPGPPVGRGWRRAGGIRALNAIRPIEGPCERSGRVQRAVVVAMIPMRMMQVPIHQVVDVIAVRYRGMAAARAMRVVGVVTFAVVGNAAVGVCARDLDDVLVVVVLMGAMQMPVMQVAHMVPVLDGDVAAVRAVGMVVIFVDFVAHVSDVSMSGFNFTVGSAWSRTFKTSVSTWQSANR